MDDAYLATCKAKVLDVITSEKQTSLVLDATIFYPQGGGQPADTGVISGKTGSLVVSHVSYNGGSVLHKGKLSGSFQTGEEVSLKIDWERRYEHMQLHTAGHILDQAVKDVTKSIKAIDGDHGIGKKPHLELNQQLSADLLPALQKRTDQIVKEGHPITFQMMTKEEMERQKIELPFDLPENKPLRIIAIGSFPAMPDGGTHLRSTDESWPIKVQEIVQKKGAWRLYYTIEKDKENTPTSESKNNTTSEKNLSLQDVLLSIEETKSRFTQDFSAQSPSDLQSKYLGKKGVFNTSHAQQLKLVSKPDKKEVGQAINQLKSFLQEGVEKAQLSSNSKHAWQDLTIPGIQPQTGHVHPISQAMHEITHIFEQIGFTRVRYPEVDWDWYVFESLNMAPDHPARDEWETFFVDTPDTTQDVEYDASNPRKRHPSLVGGKIVLTAHTSNGQVREMERLQSEPPIRMINIARCYRRQQDATHTQMFHQFEGLVVDKGINIQHLKGTLDYFAEQFYGSGTKSRIRPFHFQFTEPSFEVDFSCHICNGTGLINKSDLEPNDPRLQDESNTTPFVKCKFCKSGWHEVGGAGMVHPNVLKAGGIDPNEYTGFAFGWGIERTYTLKEGLNIDDIRLLYSGDLRFLEQF